jgi:cytochrome c oxidase cbb3-type subunit 3
MLRAVLPGARMLARVVLAIGLASSVSCQDPTGPEREISGELIYARHCARCHGPDGTGTREVPAAKDLTNVSYMETLTDERLRMIIHNGKPPAMPAFQGQFAEPSLKVLIAFVRSLSRPEAARASRPPGESENE